MNEKNDKKVALDALEKEGLLSGFLDGELDEVQMQRVSALLDAPTRQNATADTQMLRTSLRTFVRNEREQRQESFSVWESIEAQLTPYPKTPTLAERLHTFRAQLGEIFELALRPQVAGTVFACSLGLVAVSLWNRADVTHSGTEVQVAGVASGSAAVDWRGAAGPSTSVSSVVTPVLGSSGFGESSIGADSLSRLEVARSSRSGGEYLIDGQAGSTVSFVGNTLAPNPSRQLMIAQSLRPEGLRIGLTDIDWIRAKSHVEILPSSDDRRPPVIWVGSKVRR